MRCGGRQGDPVQGYIWPLADEALELADHKPPVVLVADRSERHCECWMTEGGWMRQGRGRKVGGWETRMMMVHADESDEGFPGAAWEIG